MPQESLFERVIPVDIEKEVKKSFLEYSMSVIVSRAIPDFRDGLKPVHRRILYALYDQGMTHDKPHKKSAHIVGEVMGKYHPHGDAAIYETMVKMAQDFVMRYPLIDGHGNFGSLDGDSAAAMRYTESRMSRIALEMLKDIEKDTVDFRPNYDDSRMEPQVLPARIPNLLINGSSGIAVGMATNIPPHNLTEVVEGIKLVIDNPEVSIEEIMKKIKGPDFPTAGIIMGDKGIKDAYRTGRGTIKIRARYTIEEKKGGKNAIVITEIPYQVNKARLVEKIAELVRDKKIDGITDLRDESNRQGIRIVIEVKKDANPNVIINKLFKHTQLEDSFGIIMLGLKNGEPKILNLKQIIEYYLEHRREVIERRTRFDLKKAEERLHIVEGLLKALDYLDQIIEIIRKSRDREEARDNLISEFGFTEVQANAILDMRLVQLTNLERGKLNEEYDELKAKIADYKDILSRPERVNAIIKEDLDDIKEKYGDARRTEICYQTSDYKVEDLIEDSEIVITLSNRGYIKRQPLDTYKAQKRGGKGITAAAARSEDFASQVIVTSILNDILFFTNQGRVFSCKAYQIQEASRQAKGMPLINYIDIKGDEKVTTIVAARDMNDKTYLLMVTRQGIIKKLPLSALANIRRNGLIAINLHDGDQLVGVVRVKEGEKIMLATAQGMSIIFSEKQVRPMGRTAAGVKAISLAEGDYVVGIDKYRENAYALLVTEKGYGKRTELAQFRMQNRGGKGIKSIDINDKNGRVVAFKIVSAGEELMILTEEGHIIRLETEDISVQKRYSRGVLLMRLNENDRVASLARFRVEREE
ncbi:DNA gyrase subunit A [Thermosyntropha lipolytica DSM 11003]|uniref:DNA gyrase subunit A n=1 Tax=Thermosyntropha lipolytica DSM 11003 TaxID=1123382 RepID=A0A1M5QPS6_9FIRM|nr:DNA gyrase subunit A [Thermosyntropha lipolytica]SHH16127.1 DNA gyrase subunit A [Thermosyntropha lipolytica DSM 11003]